MNTEILFVMDRSGSMSSLSNAACEGFNSFVEEQRTVPGSARVSLTVFNHSVVHRYTAIPIERTARMFSLDAGGMTAMYDGIGEALNLHMPRIEHEKWADKTIMVIITDGHENSSKKFGQSATAGMIRLAKSLGWQFVFLGANIDVAVVASKLNIDPEFSYAFTASVEGVRSIYAQASSTTRAMRSWGL